MDLAFFLLFLLLGIGSLSAQRPKFRDWNFGIAEGLTPLNNYLALPTMAAHYKNISAELSPYPVALGLQATYHFPVWTIFKKLNFNLNAAVFAATENGKYRFTFPFKRDLHDERQVGVLVGPSVYFLKRFSLHTLIGLGRISVFGSEYRSPGLRNGKDHYLLEQASISLDFRLFNTFAQ